MRCLVYVFFFFKQKTAYEMRISDWSSDVCSSDLHLLMRNVGVDRHFIARKVVVDEEPEAFVDRQFLHQRGADTHGHCADHLAARCLGIEDADRKSVV